MSKLKRRMRTAAQLARADGPTPLGALWRGAIAGAIGAGVQSLFFRATKRLTPTSTTIDPEHGKPELAARGESSLETTARRFVEGMMIRGPLLGRAKARAAMAVHYGFGAAWGGLYGLWAESAERAPGSLFGLAVWMASDNLLLPAFRLAAWPQRYRLAEHHYAVHAHLVYGAATQASYAALRQIGPGKALAALPAILGLQALAWLRRTPPGRLLARRQALPQRIWWGALNRVVARA